LIWSIIFFARSLAGSSASACSSIRCAVASSPFCSCVMASIVSFCACARFSAGESTGSGGGAGFGGSGAATTAGAGGAGAGAGAGSGVAHPATASVTTIQPAAACRARRAFDAIMSSIAKSRSRILSGGNRMRKANIAPQAG